MSSPYPALVLTPQGWDMPTDTPRMATTARRETRVVVDCVCGRSHRLRNVNIYTQVIQAFLDGELMHVTPNGIEIDCVMTVLKTIDEVR